jgi:hypothetical protein
LFQGADQLLDSINLFFSKIGLSALFADPGRYGIEYEMASFPIYMKRSSISLHFSLTINTFHFLVLTLKSLDHSLSSGRYVVIIAK